MAVEHIGYLILAYLLGSIPFGLIVANITASIDIRTQGSGNIGATNVTRILGKKLGALVLLLDALKGVIAVIIARFLDAPENIIILCAALAVLGHIAPIWLKFRGGKGVATGLAVLVALQYPLGIAAIMLWIIIYYGFKISSVAALVAFMAAPVMAFFIAPSLLWFCVFLSLIITFRHIDNIKRLLSGAEK